MKRKTPKHSLTDPFKARVLLADAAGENDPTHYSQTLHDQTGNHFSFSLQACYEYFATKAKIDEMQFIVVAYITKEGKATDIEVQPPSDFGQCFAASLTTAPFPKPPEYAEPKGFPIALKLHIHAKSERCP